MMHPLHQQKESRSGRGLHRQNTKNDQSLAGTPFSYPRENGGGANRQQPVRHPGGDMVPWQIRDFRQECDHLLEKNEKLNLLFSVARHDIGNQLAGLKLYLDLLQQRPADENRYEYLQRITGGIDQIASILRFTQEYQEIEMQAPLWQDLSVLVQAASAPFCRSPVIIDAIIPQVEILADPLIGRVFYNIFDNALQHGGTITRLTITVRNKGTFLEIICEDNGIGIPADSKERIFVKGYGKHSGFGLFLVREILNITEISIAETGEPGKGARFEILVPADRFRLHDQGQNTVTVTPARARQVPLGFPDG